MHPYAQLLLQLDEAEDAMRAWVVKLTDPDSPPDERISHGAQVVALASRVLETLVTYEVER